MEVTYDSKSKTLVIKAKVNGGVPSKSGKSLVLFSSHGNTPTTATFDGKPIVVGLNAYVKA